MEVRIEIQHIYVVLKNFIQLPVELFIGISAGFGSGCLSGSGVVEGLGFAGNGFSGDGFGSLATGKLGSRLDK